MDRYKQGPVAVWAATAQNMPAFTIAANERNTSSPMSDTLSSPWHCHSQLRSKEMMEDTSLRRERWPLSLTEAARPSVPWRRGRHAAAPVPVDVDPLPMPSDDAPRQR